MFHVLTKPSAHLAKHSLLHDLMLPRLPANTASATPSLGPWHSMFGFTADWISTSDAKQQFFLEGRDVAALEVKKSAEE
jgi:hypothetical protein